MMTRMKDLLRFHPRVKLILIAFRKGKPADASTKGTLKAIDKTKDATIEGNEDVKISSTSSSPEIKQVLKAESPSSSKNHQLKR